MRFYKSTIGCFVFLATLLLLASCVKEENGTGIVNGVEASSISGKAITSDGQPLAGLTLKVIYYRTLTPSYQMLIRTKAEATTDNKGNFKLLYTITDDELNTDSEKYVDYYEIVAETSKLNPDVYVTYGNISKMIGLKRGESLSTSVYIPKRRKMSVTLTNFKAVSDLSHFYVYTTMPYGFERDKNDIPPHNPNFPDNKYGNFSSVINLYTAKENTTVYTDIPFPLNDSCIVSIMRTNELGESKMQTHRLRITDSQPQSLTYSY